MGGADVVLFSAALLGSWSDNLIFSEPPYIVCGLKGAGHFVKFITTVYGYEYQYHVWAMNTFTFDICTLTLYYK